MVTGTDPLPDSSLSSNSSSPVFLNTRLQVPPFRHGFGSHGRITVEVVEVAVAVVDVVVLVIVVDKDGDKVGIDVGCGDGVREGSIEGCCDG